MATWRQAGPSAAQDSMQPHGAPRTCRLSMATSLRCEAAIRRSTSMSWSPLKLCTCEGARGRGARQRGVKRGEAGSQRRRQLPGLDLARKRCPEGRRGGAGRRLGAAAPPGPARPTRAPEPCPRAACTGGLRARRRLPQAWLGSTARGAPSSGRSGRAGRRGRRQRSFWGLARLSGVLRGLLWAWECVGGPGGERGRAARAGCAGVGRRGRVAVKQSAGGRAEALEGGAVYGAGPQPALLGRNPQQLQPPMQARRTVPLAPTAAPAL